MKEFLIRYSFILTLYTTICAGSKWRAQDTTTQAETQISKPGPGVVNKSTARSEGEKGIGGLIIRPEFRVCVFFFV